jgi:hypothetical protein
MTQMFGQLAAAVHTTLHEKSMTKGNAAAAQDSVTVGDGRNVKASEVANVCGMTCDERGNKPNEQAALQDVTHLPDGKFDLFSLSKLLKEG